MRFEFAQRPLDLIEVWRKKEGQVKQSRACRFDRFPNICNLVDAGIVYNNDVAAFEGWATQSLIRQQTWARSSGLQVQKEPPLRAAASRRRMS
jgi:hypothetical protein